tara:strand:+ start:10 stop:1395 length:1386 start_codon:yes stop_codon:yes gene_type:complete
MTGKKFGINIPITSPQGANNLTSHASYRFRKYYKDSVYPDTAFPTPIDLWYDVPLYGKINLNGTAVFPSETNLKQLHTNNGTFFALDFVADAYKDLKNHFKIANFQKTIEFNENNTLVSEINATTAWQSVTKLYHSYMSKVYSSFVKQIDASANARKISNFKEFMIVFEQTAVKYAKKMPLTKTGFMISRHASSAISGLVIEIHDGDHGSDIEKLQLIEDVNFEFYRNSAKNFGFFVDKNAPWRLVANLRSAKMQEYMQSYGVAFGNLFDKYYYKCYESDLDVLKQYMLDFYNSFIESFPITTEVTTSLKEKCKGETKMKTITRTPLEDFSELNPAWQINDSYWLKLYMRMRILETEVEWSEKKFDKAYDKVVTYLVSMGELAALKLINDLLISHQNNDIMNQASYTGVSSPQASDGSNGASGAKSLTLPPWYLNTKLKVLIDENDISDIPAAPFFIKKQK